MYIPANPVLKGLYCLAVLSAVLPIELLSGSSWVAFGVRGDMIFGTSGIWRLLLLAVAVYRIVQVARSKIALGVFPSTPFVSGLRWVGIVCMAIGVLGALGMVFVEPLALAKYGKPGEAGIAFYVTSLQLYPFLIAGAPGVLLFELSRILGFENKLEDQMKRQESKGSE